MNKKYRIELWGFGGEYALGKVTDKKFWEFLFEKNKKDELEAWGEYTEDEDYNFFEFGDVFHTFGVCTESLSYTVYEVFDEDGNETEVYDSSEHTTQHEFIETKCPCIEPTNDEEVFGYFGGESNEKGSFSEFFLDIDSEFDPSKLIFGITNLDETYGDVQIIDSAFYFPDNAIQIIAEEFVDEKIEDLQECLEIFQDNAHESSFYKKLSGFEIEESGEGGDTSGKSSDAYIFTNTGEYIYPGDK